MLRTKIIASSISNLTDARYFSAWGVEGLGFDLNKENPGHTSPMLVNAIKDWVSGPQIIGEFNGLQSKEEILELIKMLDLEAIQLGPFAPKEWTFDIPIYREMLISETDIPPNANFIIVKLDAELDNWKDELSKIEKISKKKPCYIDFSLNVKEYSHMFDITSPEGIILRGGEEEKVGFKSYDEIDEILEYLEED